jgi:hypothetical protein
MKRIMIITAIFLTVMMLGSMAMAAEDDSTKIKMGITTGIGQGGISSDQVNTYNYFYVNTYADLPLDRWVPNLYWRIQPGYSISYTGESDNQYLSSNTGMDERFQTIRIITGPAIDGTFKINGINSEGWYSNALLAGLDLIEAEGYAPATVIQDDFMIGMDKFYNHLHMSARIGDEEYVSGFLRDQFYFRLDDWVAVGPQVTYVWFNQDHDGDGDLNLVYEPAFGGQFRLSENSDDPRWSITAGATHGDFVGTAWHTDFWIRF